MERPSRSRRSKKALEPLPEADPSVRISLRRATGDSSRVRVFLGRRKVAELGDEAIARLGLIGGEAWDEAVRERVEGEARRAEAIRMAERWIASRASTAFDLSRKLERKGFARDVVRAVMAELDARGLLDDRAWAEASTRSFLAGRPAGRVLLESRMRAHGVSMEIAREVAREALADRDALEDATALVERKLRASSPRADREKLRRQALGMLARRGFEAEVAREAISRVLAHGEDEGAYPEGL